MNKILAVALILAVTTAAVYWPVATHDFLLFDDDKYITDNRLVRAGLTREGVRWAFTDYSTNWHPLTWISHMLDVEMFGLNPGAHHLVSLLVHCANAILLFLVLMMFTGRIWPATATAALFAVHPLHVESVAWSAERKDLLCAFFSFLAMGAYCRYARRPRIVRYLPVVLAFSLGLMAKPMIITLPFVFLLLDYWPLGRFKRSDNAAGVAGDRRPGRAGPRLVLEKFPLLALSVACGTIAFIAQSKGGTVGDALSSPPGTQLANAAVSYCRYLLKTIWPRDLSVFYPYPVEDLPLWQVAGAALVLATLTILCFRARRASPSLAVGWLWYLGTLIPVIGLVPVGAQAMADRYTYLPLIGVFIALSWGGAEFLERRRYPRAGLLWSLGAVLAALLILTRIQVGYWKDTVTLFGHAVEVAPDNELAHLDLGVALFNQGRIEEAIAHYRAVLRINPRAEDAHNNLGAALFKQGKLEESLPHFREAIRLCPDYADPYANIGISLLTQGQGAAAAPYFATADRLRARGVRRCPGQ